ncbi:hypothetical protein QYF36_026462 [Acer negundo]|nr:hypothetical protein QYF36_026462 [Acer negundo]
MSNSQASKRNRDWVINFPSFKEESGWVGCVISRWKSQVEERSRTPTGQRSSVFGMGRLLQAATMTYLLKPLPRKAVSPTL